MSSPRSASTLRVGDAERDAVVELLNRHFAAGRLTALEREERTGLALTARTVADLDVLLADLPPLDSLPGRAPRPKRHVVTAHVQRTVAAAVLVAAAVFLAFHLVPVLAAVAVVLVVTRVVAASHRGWRHPRPRCGWGAPTRW